MKKTNAEDFLAFPDALFSYLKNLPPYFPFLRVDISIETGLFVFSAAAAAALLLNTSISLYFCSPSLSPSLSLSA